MPGFLARTAMAAPGIGFSGSRRGPADRILVVVQLTGGNDGLNTVIPFADDRYHKARPTLRITPDRVHRLNDALGLHPAMGSMKRLYDEGLLSIVTNVGYPNPDRSHFRSMDIWHTAHMNPDTDDDGWLGRVVDATAREGAPPSALLLDDVPLPLALRSRRQAVPSVGSIESLRLDGMSDSVRASISAVRAAAAEDLLYVQRTAISSCDNARRIEDIASRGEHGSGYPAYGLANRLSQIEQLIGACFGASIYYTTLSGFDTHSKQAIAHEPLLRELSDSVGAFFAGLKRRGLEQHVTLMTFSEFGRRVNENGSQGTDHGAAAPLFIAGAACKAGVVGAPPDLANLVDGDVAHKVDFRDVYAGVLADWLHVDAGAVLGERRTPVSIIKG